MDDTIYVLPAVLVVYIDIIDILLFDTRAMKEYNLILYDILFTNDKRLRVCFPSFTKKDRKYIKIIFYRSSIVLEEKVNDKHKNM